MGYGSPVVSTSTPASDNAKASDQNSPNTILEEVEQARLHHEDKPIANARRRFEVFSSSAPKTGWNVVLPYGSNGRVINDVNNMNNMNGMNSMNNMNSMNSMNNMNNVNNISTMN